MGVEDANAPPKKKLKQAQLSFCLLTPKSNKRKLSCEELSEGGQAVKIACKEENALTNKENLALNNSIALTHSEAEKEVDPNPTQDTVDDENKKKDDQIIVETLEKSGTEEEKLELSLEITQSEFNQEKDDQVEKCPSNKEKDEIDSINIEEDRVSAKDSEGEKVADESKNDSFEATLNLTTESEDDVHISSLTTPTSARSVSKRLTPKQKLSLEKRIEKERLKEAKAKLKEETLKKKMQENDEKRKRQAEKKEKKQEELRLKEEDRKLKEEERKKKEEERKKKEDEKKKKEDEKKKKEEAREEEKRKKEEARLIEERKEAQAKLAFSSFFISKKNKRPSEHSEKVEETESSPNFMPFPVKPDMRLAGERRTPLSPKSKEKLEKTLKNEIPLEKNELYLNRLRNGHVPRKTEPTWPPSEEQHDVIIIESIGEENQMDIEEDKMENTKSKELRAKLYQFHDNRRPPYWGTWRKKSANIKPRKPFTKDFNLDYEVDSDSEWEDEGEGEDIGVEGADSEKEQSDDENVGENGYLLDGTFVPHGYLSDEEAADDDNLNPEDQKLRMKVLKQQFDEEMKSKTQRLKPRLLGCVWITNETAGVSNGSLYETMFKFRAVWDEDLGGIDLSAPVVAKSPTVCNNKQIPKEVMDTLVKFVHGSPLPLSKILLEFRTMLEKDHPTAHVSKSAIKLKVREIASKSHDSNWKPCWVVNDQLRNEYGLQKVDLDPKAPPPPVKEKPKENLLTSFFKPSTTSPQQTSKKKRVSLITIKEGSAKEREESVGTPPPPVKKRVSLVTLSTTPKMCGKQTVHVDTPRPLHPLAKALHENSVKSTQVVDLTEESP